MLATLAQASVVAAMAAVVAVLIRAATRWESIADLRERVAALEATIEPDPDEDTPP